MFPQHGREKGMLKVSVLAHLRSTPPKRPTDDDDLPEPLEAMIGRAVYITVSLQAHLSYPLYA